MRNETIIHHDRISEIMQFVDERDTIIALKDDKPVKPLEMKLLPRKE